MYGTLSVLCCTTECLSPDAENKWNAINPYATPNAGEKCPTCKGRRSLKSNYGVYDCPNCQGTGLKPAVESPAAEVKELSEQEVKSHYAILEAMNAASDFAFRSKSRQSRDYEIARWHLSDLTTKLAALQVEKESFRKELEYISETLCGVKVEGDIKHDMVSAFVEGQIDKLDDTIERLHVKNKSQADRITELMENCVAKDFEIESNKRLVKEVERLREALKFYADDATHEEIVNKRQVFKPVDMDLGAKAKEALKPTPEESGSKRNP